MRRYKFGLGAVMRVRRVQESMAKAELQKANTAVVAAELAAEHSQSHYEQVSAATGQPFMAQAERANLAARAAIEARQSLVGARQVAVAAMDQYLAATRAVSVLGRLDARRRDEHALAFQHEEATVVDELVTSRHIRRQDQLSRKGRR